MSTKSVIISSFFLGLILVSIGRVVQVQLRREVFTPQKSTFTFKPPEQAIKGKVRSVNGDVRKQSRDSDKLEKIDVPQPVLQGDKIVTRKNAAVTIQFDDIGIVNINSDSTVNIISLLPASFLIQQTSGDVTYESVSNKPLSIRSLHALFTIQSGRATVESDREKGELIISVASGKGKLAMIDTENETHTWDIKAGQKAVIDDEARTVKIRK